MLTVNGGQTNGNDCYFHFYFNNGMGKFIIWIGETLSRVAWSLRPTIFS